MQQHQQPAQSSRKLTAYEYVTERVGRLADFPHTAPAYDDVTKPTEAPACSPTSRRSCRILALTKIVLRPVTRVIHAIERRAGWFGSPVFGVLAYVGIMWIYHIPAIYDLALRNDVVHTIGHIGFFTAGTLYWWHLLTDPQPHPARRHGARRLHGDHQDRRRRPRCALDVLPAAALPPRPGARRTVGHDPAHRPAGRRLP